jgi:hypothetical protein
MIKHKFQNSDGETVEVWLANNCPHADELNRLVDIQLNGIKSFYTASKETEKSLLAAKHKFQEQIRCSAAQNHYYRRQSWIMELISPVGMQIAWNLSRRTHCRKDLIG